DEFQLAPDVDDDGPVLVPHVSGQSLLLGHASHGRAFRGGCMWTGLSSRRPHSTQMRSRCPPSRSIGETNSWGLVSITLPALVHQTSLDFGRSAIRADPVRLCPVLPVTRS